MAAKIYRSRQTRFIFDTIGDNEATRP